MQLAQIFSNIQKNTMDAAVNIELGIKPDADRSRISKLMISIADKVFSFFSSNYKEQREVALNTQRAIHFGDEPQAERPPVMTQIQELGKDRLAKAIFGNNDA